MKKHIIILFSLFLFCTLMSAQKPYISQVFYDSPLEEDKFKTGSNYPHNIGEFIEIYNPSSFDINISGWKLRGTEAKEIFMFPKGSVIASKSYIIVTYRNSVCNTKLSNIFKRLKGVEYAGIIHYQDNIILYNKGEKIFLIDMNKDVIDQMVYGNFLEQDTLYARNGAGKPILNCKSLHRKNVTRDDDGNAIFLRSDWTHEIVYPMKEQEINNDYLPFELCLEDIPLSHNYIYTRKYMSEEKTTYVDHVQYYDGLGRPDQLLLRNVTPTRSNLISLQEYDEIGRDFRSWLNIPIANDDVLYNSEEITIDARKIHKDDYPFKEKVYESSPLNRIEKLFGVGQEWRKNGGHAIEHDYYTNNNGDFKCAYYFLNGDAIQKKGDYPAGTLYVNKIADEDGNIIYEFKDKQGRVILIRQMNGTIPHDTYYIYDDFNNLAFVLPPLAADGLTSNATWDLNTKIIKDYAYAYKYDNRHRCIWKKLPGAEPIYYIYDNADHLIFSQNGEQRDNGKWSFTIPDILGRYVLQGVCKNVPDISSVFVKADYSINPSGVFEELGFSLSGITNLESMQIYQVFYYDNYDFKNLSN